MKTPRTLFASIIILAYLLLPTLGENEPGDHPFSSAASAPIGDNIFAAQNKALAEARMDIFVAAGDQALGSGNGRILYEAIKDDVAAYLNEEKTLKQGLKEDEWFVQLSALVSFPQLLAASRELGIDAKASEVAIPQDQRKKLGGLKGNQPLPRVAVIAQETYETEGDPPKLAEPLVQDWLTNQGFAVIAMDQVQANALRDKAALILSGDLEAAAAVAGHIPAEWILHSDIKIRSEQGIQGSTLRRFTVEVRLKLLQQDTGASIGNGNGNSSMANLPADEIFAAKQLLPKALDKALEQLKPNIDKYVAGVHPLSGRMRLRVFGALPAERARVEKTVFSGAGILPESAIITQHGGMLEFDLLSVAQPTNKVIERLVKSKVGSGHFIVLQSTARSISVALRDGSPAANPELLNEADALLGEWWNLRFAEVDSVKLRRSSEELKKKMASLKSGWAQVPENGKKLNELQDEINSLEASLQRAEDELEQVTQSLSSAQKELQKLQDQMEELVEKVGEAEARNSDLAERLREKENSVSNLALNVSGLRNDLRQKRITHSSYVTRINAIQ